MELQLTLIIISPHSAIKNIESINRPIIMKSFFTILLFSLLCNLSFAQDKVESNELSVKITLSDEQAVNAKSLKSIEFGELYKGINRNTFLIRTSDENLESLKRELTKMFPGCSVSKEENK